MRFSVCFASSGWDFAHLHACSDLTNVKHKLLLLHVELPVAFFAQQQRRAVQALPCCSNMGSRRRSSDAMAMWEVLTVKRRERNLESRKKSLQFQILQPFRHLVRCCVAVKRRAAAVVCRIRPRFAHFWPAFFCLLNVATFAADSRCHIP